AKLCEQVRERKARLTSILRAGGSILDNDQEWLDGEGNLIDEERVVEVLDDAFDYECGLQRLGPEGKIVVQQLEKLVGGGKSDDPSKKQKCRHIFLFQCQPNIQLLLVGPDTVLSNKPSLAKPGKKDKPAAIFEKKVNATLKQRIEILNWHHANGKNQTKIAKHFNVRYPDLQLKQPRISSWLKDESKW
ncbi:hypothetical protein J3R83DRAFT_7789, partial [Lanmaoa asiatica]